ncbi:hypothetical protein MED134_01625 [Dokdonia sp. MED134]|nr:hypothetical protein [Dokdonia sp. MED134]EAQ39278.1 hypothetical protein MED134_01625 [Dokdonia sp. MED134]
MKIQELSIKNIALRAIALVLDFLMILIINNPKKRTKKPKEIFGE